MTPIAALLPESRQVDAPVANDRESVAATDEVTRSTETLARSTGAFNGTGTYWALAPDGRMAGTEAGLELAPAWR